MNSFKHYKYVDNILKEELRIIYINILSFYIAFFKDIIDLETRLRLFLRNAKKVVIHSIIKRVSKTDSLKM
jgi:hypothetical protein